jgi:hypothetical protein
MRLIDADEMIKGLSKFITCKLGEIKAVDIKKFINKQPTVEPNQWIPCSERLPEIYEDTCTSEIVLVQGYDKEIDYEWQAMGWYADEMKQWFFAECKNTDKQIDWIDIIAWMPLPQAYTGKESD